MNLSDPLFAFPDAVRFSWAPVKTLIEEKGQKVLWEAEEDRKDGGAADEKQTRWVRTKISRKHFNPN